MSRSQSESPLLPAMDVTERDGAENATMRDAAQGAQCSSCGSVVLSVALACHICRSTELEPCVLPQHGTLVSFTTVHVSSDRSVPYSLGYVDLPGDVRVLAPLVSDGHQYACDQPVRATVVDGVWGFVPREEVAP